MLAQVIGSSQGDHVSAAASAGAVAAADQNGRTQACSSRTDYHHLLSGMMSRRLGIEAICFVLTLAREALLDLVVECGLPTPHDGPMRPCTGPRAWHQADYAVLVAGWLQNWQAGVIAEGIGRSKGSVWAKARRLGFPRRDRRGLVWPSDLPQFVARQEPLPRQKPERNDAYCRPLRQRVPGTAEEIYLDRKRGGSEIEWVTPGEPHLLQRHVSLRRFSGQRPGKIADALGISLRAVTSMLWWLQVPKLPRELDTDAYDPDVAQKNISALGYREAKCVSNPNYIFWQHRMQRTRSRRDEKAGVYAIA